MDTTVPIGGSTAPATRRRLRVSFPPAVLDMLAVTFAGALFRLGPLLTSTFPLHDGGMFVVMIRDIRAAGMSLPAFTSYNGGGIPFDYPPLALWVAALLPADPLTIVRFAGPLAAVLTVPMVYLLALELLPGRPYAYVSALLYAVVPRGWDWLIAGGSLTRTPGFLLALVGIWMLLRLYRTGRSRYVIGAAVFGGLAVLTHPEAALFLAVASGLLALVRVRDRATLRSTIWVATGIFLVALPWPLILATRGHLMDLAQVGSQGINLVSSFVSIFMWRFTDEVYAPAILALGLIGALALVQRRSAFVALWLVVEACLVLRGSATYACVPLAMAASVGLYDGIGQGILRIPSSDVFRSTAVRGLLLLVLAWSAFNDVGLWYMQDPPFDGLSPSGVSTMAWLKANTPSDASFAVVGGKAWPEDVYGEWLPALTDRVSVATIQGREWASRSAWDEALASYNSLQTCVYFDAECVVTWAKAHPEKGTAFVYVVDSLASHALLLDVEASPQFQVVHKGDDGVVARLVAGPGTTRDTALTH
jgi:hypothetical protein